MKKVLLVLSVLLIGCTSYQPITSTDPIYGYTTNTIENEFELQRLLRTDFKFRYDFAQFAMRQPLTWQWSNRMSRYRFNRYNYWNPYNPMDYTQMWNDWLWGYNSWNAWGSPHRWSPFGYDRWGYDNYGWGYNGYYGNSWYWRTQMNTFAWQNRNRTNTVRVNGRRGSTISVRNRIGQAAMIESTKRRVNTKPRVYVRPPIRTNTPNINRTININNRPVINRTNTSPNINRTITPNKNINTTPKKRGN